eukprot:IDg12072t1
MHLCRPLNTHNISGTRRAAFTSVFIATRCPFRLPCARSPCDPRPVFSAQLFSGSTPANPQCAPDPHRAPRARSHAHGLACAWCCEHSRAQRLLMLRARTAAARGAVHRPAAGAAATRARVARKPACRNCRRHPCCAGRRTACAAYVCFLFNRHAGARWRTHPAARAARDRAATVPHATGCGRRRPAHERGRSRLRVHRRACRRRSAGNPLRSFTRYRQRPRARASRRVCPCDGTLAPESPSAFVAVPHLTGESTPRAVAPGNDVPAGARSLDGPLLVRVTRVGEESSLARIERLVADAQESRPAVLSFFDRFGRFYSRAVLIVAAAIAFCLPALRPIVGYGGHNGSFKRALSFLVVTSPCALVIAAPLAHVATLSACARRGVLVKSGARAIEHAARTTSVVFDKTGTLTTGNLTLVAVTQLLRVPAEAAQLRAALGEPDSVGMKTAGDARWTEVSDAKLRELVSVAASLERNAVHPLANAILTKAKTLGVPFLNTDDVRTVSGQGIEGVVSSATNEGDFIMSMSRIGRTTF